jgi:hypothetical protein
MTTVDRTKTLAELAAAPTLTAGNIAAAIKALGRDGVLDAADQAGLASVIAGTRTSERKDSLSSSDSSATDPALAAGRRSQSQPTSTPNGGPPPPAR